jgi:thiol oxidase
MHLQQMIAGDALNALHDYVDVLTKFFPFRQDRPNVKNFLQQIRQWILSHDDAIKGEDLAIKVKEIQDKVTRMRHFFSWTLIKMLPFQTSAFNDLPSTWIACQGSAPNFGGYPCGLWTLFHTLTIQQKKLAKDEPKCVPSESRMIDPHSLNPFQTRPEEHGDLYRALLLLSGMRPTL